MSKLSIDQMCEIAGGTKTAEELQIKTTRYSSFLKVGALNQGVDTAPAYQVEFWKAYKEFDGSIEDIKEALKKIAVVTAQKEDTRPVSGGEMVLAKKPVLAGKKFVFTSAQNNTEVHHKFLASLLTYCQENEAQLIIGQFTYNKNGFQNGQNDDNEIWFAPELREFFNVEAAKVCKGLAWCGELNILPTAKYPLSGLEQYTGLDSCIVPHAKIAMESVATLAGQDAKLMYATGTVTQHNYIQKKTGQLAQSEHCYGALVVEISDNGTWFCRQIQTDETGEFQDLTTVYGVSDIFENQPISAVTWGDLHSEKQDGEILAQCSSMLHELKPDYQFFHDCFDMTSRNHHNRKSGHFLMAQQATAQSVEGDLRMCADVLDVFDNGSKRVVVESNHDLALELWLDSNEYDYRKDPINALTFLQLQTAKYTAITRSSQDFNVLRYALENIAGMELNDIEFLKVDESYKVKGIEQGIHGHIGANGSKGSPKQFRKLSVKVNTGHTHSASIHGNVYTAGVTGSLDMEYNKGASSWSHSHIITYPDGMRSIITMRPNGWKA